MDEKHVKVFYTDISKADATTLYDEMGLIFEQKRREKIDRCQNEIEKRRQIVTGALLEKVLFSFGIRDSQFVYLGADKPYLKGHKNFFFNISHSKDYVVMAVSGQDIGCDIQERKKIKENVFDRITSVREREYLSSMAFDLTFVWAVKESYSKYLGEGLAKSFRDISFVKNSDDYYAVYDKGKLSAYGKRINLLKDYELFVCAENKFEIDDCQYVTF